MIVKHISEQVFKASLKFLEPLSLHETYEVIVNEGMKLVNAQHGSILIEQNDRLHRVYASSPTLYKVHPRKRGLMYSVFKKRKPLILKSTDVKKIHPEMKEIEFSSDINIPLFYRNKSIGVLTVQSAKNYTFTQGELHTLKLFG